MNAAPVSSLPAGERPGVSSRAGLGAALWPNPLLNLSPDGSMR